MDSVSHVLQARAPQVPGHSCTFVTGATGFVGHFVLPALLQRGHTCAALLRPPVESRPTW
jgi:hypothetical protein